MVLLLLLLLTAAVPAAEAETPDAVTAAQEAVIDLDGLERAAKQSGGSARYGETLDQGLDRLLSQGAQEGAGILKRAARSGVVLAAILLLCGFAASMYEAAGGGRVDAVTLAGALSVALVAAGDVNSMLGLGRSAIENMTSFSNVLFPAVAAVTAATGAVTGAAVRQAAATLFSGLLVALINGLLVPLLYGYLAVCAAQAAVGNEGLRRIAALLKWAITTLLTAVMLAFVGYLTVSGVVSGSADAAAVKAAKFAISGAIPVVGGILSDAADTILASAGILKGAVGVFGTVTILGICLLPLLRLAAHYLVYKLTAAVAASVAPPRVVALVDQIGGAFALLMGMTGACCLLQLVALVSSVSAVAA